MNLTFEALNALEWLSLQGPGNHRLPDEVCPTKYQGDVFLELAQQELIIDERRLAGGASFQISPDARARVDRLAKRYRQAAIQLEMMTRISSAPDRESTDSYFPPEKVRGEPVREEEFKRAVDHLLSVELIKGTKVWGGDLVRPELTPRGYEAFESGYAPQDWVEMQNRASSITNNHGGHNTMNINGTVGAAQQGPGNTANVTQSIGLDTLIFDRAMESMLALLQRAEVPAQTQQAAIAQLDLIDEAARNGTSRGKVENFFHLMVAALPAAVASEMTGFVGEAMSAFSG